MYRIITSLVFTLSFSYLGFSQANCDEPQRYLDHIFETTDLDVSETVFANFTADQLWNNGDTTASNICFDPRNYLSPKSDGTWDMSMTVFQPKDAVDNCTQRASIVFLHGGGYAHIPGNNTSTNAVAGCVDLAQRGYVVSLINYRKGWDIRKALNITGLGPLLPGCQNCPCENGNNDCEAYSFMKITYAMAQDARAAHRKMLNEKLSYGIDEELVFYMGASTGAVGVLHAAHGADDMPAYQDDNGLAMSAHLGEIDAVGELINNGSNFKIAGVSTIAGAIKESDWIESSDNIPIMFNHTTLDEAVQYCIGTILNMKYFINLNNEVQHLTLEGPGRLYKDIRCLADTTAKTKAWLRTHKGLYHNFCAPLGSTDPSDNCDALSSVTLVQRLNAEFMKEVILGNTIYNNHKLTEAGHVSGPCNIINADNETPCTNHVPCIVSNLNIDIPDDLKVYPNPAKVGSIINISSDQSIEFLELFDLQGNKIYKAQEASIRTPSEIANGVYYLRIKLAKEIRVKKILIL